MHRLWRQSAWSVLFCLGLITALFPQIVAAESHYPLSRDGADQGRLPTGAAIDLVLPKVRPSGDGDLSPSFTGPIPDRIVPIGTSVMTTTVNELFSLPLQAQVSDSGNQPISGVDVVFATPLTEPTAYLNGFNVFTVTTDANGIATAPVPHAGSGVGTYQVTATVSGVSGSAVYTLTNVPFVPVYMATSVLTLTASSSLVFASDPLTLTALVTKGTLLASLLAIELPPPSGTVTFTSDSGLLQAAVITGGVASMVTTNLPVGNHVITATYSGDSIYRHSSATITVTISPRQVAVPALSVQRSEEAPILVRIPVGNR